MTPNQLIQLLQELASLHGDDISLKLFQNLSGVTSLEIKQHFQTWSALRVAAGLTSRTSRPKTTADEVLAALKKSLKKHGPRLSLQVFSQESGISERVIYSRCGSWSKLRLSLGLTSRANASRPKPVPRKAKKQQRPTKEQILDRMRDAIHKHGENITFIQFRNETGFGNRLIVTHFGYWSNLRTAAGLTPVPRIPPRYTRDDLLNDLAQVYRRTGHDPKMNTYRHDGGQVSNVTIRAHFGNWPNAIKALHDHLAEWPG